MDARSGAAGCARTFSNKPLSPNFRGDQHGARHGAQFQLYTRVTTCSKSKHTAHLLYEPAARLRGAPTRVLYIYGSVQAHFFSHFPDVAHIREDIKMAVSNNHRAGRKMSSEPPMNGVQKGRLEMRLCNPQDNATTSTRTYASFRCADALGYGNLTMPHR